MKKLTIVITILLVFALAMVLYSYDLSYAEEYSSPRDLVDEVEEGMTEEIGPEEPLPPFA